MPASIVLGTQWGDEGKGKAVDYLADRMDLVVRYQGGNNAGHTVIAEGRLLKLQLIPSGILYPHITSVIADGVVVDPSSPEGGRRGPRDRGRRVPPGGQRQRAHDHAVPPGIGEGHRTLPGQERARHHQARDRPAYGDKAARIGLRIQDLFDEKIFREKLEIVLREKNLILTKIYNRLPLDAERIVDEYMTLAERIEPMVVDTASLLHESLTQGKHVMFEGRRVCCSTWTMGPIRS